MNHEIIKNGLLFVAAAILLTACSDKNNSDNTGKNPVGLTTHKIEVPAKGGTYTITATGSWWLENMQNGDDPSDFVLMYPDFASGETEEKPVHQFHDWLTLERLDAHNIRIEMTENKESKMRKVFITLTLGDWSDTVRVLQQGK